MRCRIFILIATLSILFFGFARKTDVTQRQSDISKAVELIKRHLDNRGLFTITITNSHNGRYIVASSILTRADSVTLQTHITDMTGGKRDTTIFLSRKDFLSKLDRARDPINSIKLAGHHQRISVKRNELEETFNTVDGRTLMNILEYGE